MAGLYDRLAGTAQVEICGVFPESVLNTCAQNGVELWGLESVDAYTLRVFVHERELSSLRGAAGRCMCDLKVLSLRGGSKNRRLLLRRKGLIAAALLTAALLTLSSFFIWEIDVTGCGTLTEGQVLRALEDCGVGQGTFWPSVSADLVRSRVLTALPELAWMTVNVSGSRAMVLLTERQEKPEIYLESEAADLVAERAGIITGMSVYNGKPLVREGQAVAKGEVLVSGLMDSITGDPRQVRAQAKVMADTWVELTAVSPAQTEIKQAGGRCRTRFALRFGKKRLNLYRNREKRLDEYDKIVYEYNLGWDGLFALPVTLVREKLIFRERAPGSVKRTGEMEQRLSAGLREQIDGEVVSSSFSTAESGGLICVTLRAQCRENIARRSAMP